jgi:hypothetical protein
VNEHIKKSTWQILSSIDVNEHVDKKQNGCTYLSWAWAWGITKEHFPDTSYRVVTFDNGRPYLFDEYLGYMVQTEVTINCESLPMHLFVMDGANKAQKHIEYTYRTKNSGEKTCTAASMFDINTAIMRCLTKNLALFGLGHYIYAGEDLPHESIVEKNKKEEEFLKIWIDKISSCETIDELRALYPTFPKSIRVDLKDIATQRSKILNEVVK